MRITKPRNRENRTKATKAVETLTIQIKLPRDTYDLVKELERNKVCTREEIFLTGLAKVC